MFALHSGPRFEPQWSHSPYPGCARSGVCRECVGGNDAPWDPVFKGTQGISPKLQNDEDKPKATTPECPHAPVQKKAKGCNKVYDIFANRRSPKELTGRFQGKEGQANSMTANEKRRGSWWQSHSKGVYEESER